ncbi:MAG: copper chaperone PCu(A)C [Rhodobacter sp.]|nr:copper chaperone PCu(A)C [Rhodobacter sp.]MCY4169785.1 copper chaperone PCu(A)C [Rhodobacter sp.]
MAKGDASRVMSGTSALIAALLVWTAAVPSLAEIAIESAYARAAGPSARVGAAFMTIRNDGEIDDRLISASSDASARVELHTHMVQGDGVMRMMEARQGFAVPAGGSHSLDRGGDHVMFMGLTEPWRQGDLVPVTLVFEVAGKVTLEIRVDMER